MAWSNFVFPLLLGAVIWLLPYRGGRATMLFLLAGGSVIVALAVATAWWDWQGYLAWHPLLPLSLDATASSAPFLVTVPVVALPIVLFAGSGEAEGRARLLSMLLAFVGAMQLLILAQDLLTLLLAWELVGLCSWVLINHEWRGSGNAADANWAFLVTRTGDLGLFIAVFCAWVGTGSLHYETLHLLDGSLLHIFVAGITLAAASKSAQVPFSPWLFNAMAGPAPVSALLHAATMVAAGVYVLVVLHGTLALAPWFSPVVVAIGLTTATAGAVVAMFQWHAKKLLAASTSAHYGFMWIAIGAGYPAVGTLHFVTHAVMKGSLFLLAGVAGTAAGSYVLGMRLGSRLRAMAFASAVSCLALAGMVPLGAGWTKEKVITSAGHMSVPLAVGTMVAGALAAIYAFRFHHHAFGRGDRAASSGRDPLTWESMAIHALVAANLLLSLLWIPAVADMVARVLGQKLPGFKLWEAALSIALLLLAALAGGWMIRRGKDRERAFIANWFALGAVGQYLIVKPVQVTGWLSAIWDNAMDQALSGTVIGARRVLAPALARRDDAMDRVLSGTAIAVRSVLGTALAKRDDAWIDRSVMALGNMACRFATWSSLSGEWLMDRVPQAPAGATNVGGLRVRSLQTGFSHHYYALAVIGLGLVLCLLALGVL